MFCRQLNARFSALFSGYREEEHGEFNAENAARFLGDARRVRCKDYIFKMAIENGVPASREVTTTPNWFFVLTNAAIFCTGNLSRAARVKVTFPDYPVDTPFCTAIEDAGFVPGSLVFGREGGERFEEFKNLFYTLGDRININAAADSDVGESGYLYLLLTGIEIDLKGVE